MVAKTTLMSLAPIDPRKTFGNRGEDLAAAFFEARGFKVVERNWSCRLGEIDLIVEKENCTHFVEVKTRTDLSFGYPEEAITRSKIRHLEKAIEVYLTQSSVPIKNYQLDGLAILAPVNGDPEYHYIEHLL